MLHPHRPAALLALALGLVALTLQSTPAASAAAPAKFSDLSRQLEQQGQQQHYHLRLRGDAGRPTHKEPPVWPEQFHAGTCRAMHAVAWDGVGWWVRPPMDSVTG